MKLLNLTLLVLIGAAGAYRLISDTPVSLSLDGATAVQKRALAFEFTGSYHPVTYASGVSPSIGPSAAKYIVKAKTWRTLQKPYLTYDYMCCCGGGCSAAYTCDQASTMFTQVSTTTSSSCPWPSEAGFCVAYNVTAVETDLLLTDLTIEPVSLLTTLGELTIDDTLSYQGDVFVITGITPAVQFLASKSIVVRSDLSSYLVDNAELSSLADCSNAASGWYSVACANIPIGNLNVTSCNSDEVNNALTLNDGPELINAFDYATLNLGSKKCLSLDNFGAAAGSNFYLTSDFGRVKMMAKTNYQAILDDGRFASTKHIFPVTYLNKLYLVYPDGCISALALDSGIATFEDSYETLSATILLGSNTVIQPTMSGTITYILNDCSASTTATFTVSDPNAKCFASTSPNTPVTLVGGKVQLSSEDSSVSLDCGTAVSTASCLEATTMSTNSHKRLLQSTKSTVRSKFMVAKSYMRWWVWLIICIVALIILAWVVTHVKMFIHHLKKLKKYSPKKNQAHQEPLHSKKEKEEFSFPNHSSN